jgi:hypothetical protein
VPAMHRVGIHDPGHDLRIRADVRRRNITIRTDQNADFRCIAAGQPLEFTHRQRARIDNHRAFCTAVGNIDRRALPCHPHAQCAHIIDRDLRMVANAPLCRTACNVVMDTVPDERFDPTIIHLDRKRHRQFTLRNSQDAAETGFELQEIGCNVELALRAGERAFLLHSHTSCPPR